MAMLFFLVILAAVFIFFSEEITTVLKKWYGVYWVRVTGPLVLISWAWIWYDEFIPLLLAWLQAWLVFFVSVSAQFLPHSMQWIIHALGLFLLASLPAWGMYWKMGRDVVTASQHEYIMLAYLFSWLFFVVVLLA